MTTWSEREQKVAENVLRQIKGTDEGEKKEALVEAATLDG